MKLSPVSLAVVFSLFVTGLALSIGIALGGSYLLTLHAINQSNQVQASLAQREATAKVREAVPECRQLVALDAASQGAVNASSDPNSYGHRLARAIHSFNVASRCPVLLADVAKHESYSKIAKQLGG